MMKSATSLLVFLVLASCSPKKTKVEPSEPPPPASLNAPTPAPQKNTSLIGSWRSCAAYPQGEIIGVKSTSLVYTFALDARVTMKAEFFTDEDCRNRFTREKAAETFQVYESLSRAAAPDDVKSVVFELADGMQEEMGYLASEVAAGEMGTLDFLSLQKPSYTSYRIWNDRIQIASVCHEEDVESCDPVGDTPLNRAMDLMEAEVLLRVGE